MPVLEKENFEFKYVKLCLKNWPDVASCLSLGVGIYIYIYIPTHIYIYIYIYVRVCVCVWRERKRERQTDRQTESEQASNETRNIGDVPKLFIQVIYLNTVYLSSIGLSINLSPGIYIRGSLNKFPHFFRKGTFIDNTHMKL